MAATGTKTLLVYKSVHHQNTARIARAMAGVLGADCAAPEDCPYERLAHYDLLGLGSGVYYGGVHEELRNWVSDLPVEYAQHVRVFVFTTSGLPFLAPFWHRPLRQSLTKKGFSVIGEFACRGFDTWGPLWVLGGLNTAHPDERDCERAMKFAAQMATKGANSSHLASPA